MAKDTNPYGKAKKGESAAQKKDRQKKFYSYQRKSAETKAARGDRGAAATASKIQSKLGNKRKASDYGSQARGPITEMLNNLNAKLDQIVQVAAPIAMALGGARGMGGPGMKPPGMPQGQLPGPRPALPGGGGPPPGGMPPRPGMPPQAMPGGPRPGQPQLASGQPPQPQGMPMPNMMGRPGMPARPMPGQAPPRALPGGSGGSVTPRSRVSAPRPKTKPKKAAPKPRAQVKTQTSANKGATKKGAHKVKGPREG